MDIYGIYEGLWNANNENYMKKIVKEHSFKSLCKAGFGIPGEETLRKKITNLEDVYRNEADEVEKSMKSGVGTDNVYKPRLVWSDKADSWRNIKYIWKGISLKFSIQ